MRKFEKAPEDLIKSVETLLLEHEFTVCNPLGDTISGGWTDFSVSLSNGDNLTFTTIEDAVNKLYERTQEFC